MRRTTLTLPLLLLALFCFTTNAHALGIQLTVHDTEVQASRNGSGYTKEHWYETIGAASLFGGNNIAFTVANNGAFTIDLFTNFDPSHRDAHGTQVGDLFLITETTVFAFDLSNWGSGSASFYSGTGTKPSNTVYRNGNNGGFVFGVDYRIAGQQPFGTGPIVRRDGGAQIFTASVSRTSSGSQPLYTYTINSGPSFTFRDLLQEMDLQENDTVDFVWAHTCGNAVMLAQGTIVTPEPGTFMLLGLGLAGLIWFRKRSTTRG